MLCCWHFAAAAAPLLHFAGIVVFHQSLSFIRHNWQFDNQHQTGPRLTTLTTITVKSSIPGRRTGAARHRRQAIRPRSPRQASAAAARQTSWVNHLTPTANTTCPPGPGRPGCRRRAAQASRRQRRPPAGQPVHPAAAAAAIQSQQPPGAPPWHPNNNNNNNNLPRHQQVSAQHQQQQQQQHSALTAAPAAAARCAAARCCWASTSAGHHFADPARPPAPPPDHSTGFIYHRLSLPRQSIIALSAYPNQSNHSTHYH